MSDIKFSTDDMDRIVGKVKDYFAAELDQDIGGFDAEFLVDFFGREIGPYFYNKGLADAHALINEKHDELSYLIEELEKPAV